MQRSPSATITSLPSQGLSEERHPFSLRQTITSPVENAVSAGTAARSLERIAIRRF